jgi:histidine triad (HIT) family protein
MEPSIFDRIVSGDLPSFKLWEDNKHLAFLSRWPNTPGFTVVVPKKNPGPNYLDVNEKIYTDLLLAARTVAGVLREALGCYRVGLVIEGEGVPHLHVKLIPMHGQSQESGLHEHEAVFTETYQGYLTTANGPEQTTYALAAMQEKIRAAVDKAK